MTVTLGDVSALCGLCIDSDPIGGMSDHPDLQNMIPELLGCHAENLQKKLKKKKRGEDDFQSSGYCISLAALQSHFFQNQIYPETDDLEAVRRYIRAFMLDLRGAVMFVDSSDDAVPIMFLYLLRDIENPSRWNWGGVVLAHLYSALCHACPVKNRQIHGSLLLLQHWSWSHLPVCWKIIPDPPPQWAEPGSDRCPAYGAIWGSHHSYEETGRRISYVLSQLQMLRDANIN